MVQKHSDRHCSCSGDLQVFAVNSRVLEEVAGMSVFLCATPELIPDALLGEEGVELWQDRIQHSFLTREWVCTHGKLLQSSVFHTGDLTWPWDLCVQLENTVLRCSLELNAS